MLQLKVPFSKNQHATAKSGMVKQIINKINTLKKECSMESGTCPLPGTISPGKHWRGSPESGILGSSPLKGFLIPSVTTTEVQ